MNTFFLPYQIRWIRDNSRIKLMEKSRQIGLSWATAYRCTRQALCQSKKKTWICSSDAKQAQLFLQDCKQFATILDQTVPFKCLTSAKKSTLMFKNGSELTAISSNADAQAGKRGSRILDEFALHDDPEYLYNIAYPGITWGGQLEIISTHRGNRNFFNQLIQEACKGGNPKKISLHKVTLTDALEQGFLKKLKAKLPPDDPRCAMDESDYFNFIKNACASEQSFRQEYLCQPIDDATAFIEFKELEPCFYDSNTMWNKRNNGPTFMGVDIARTNDLSVFVIFEKLNDVYFMRHLQCLKNARFDEQEQVFEQLFRTYSVQNVCIDRTGIGSQFFERAQTKFGTYCIEGISFTAKLKEELAYKLKNTFNRYALRIPRDEALITDLLSVQWEQTQLTAQHSSNGHADRFWAIALALYADRKQASTPFKTELFMAPKPYKFYEN